MKAGRPVVFAVVPVKDIRDAKQRLSPFLSSSERRGLFKAMLTDVLSALSAAHGLSGIVVVTRDPEVERIAADYAAEILREPENLGQTQAVSFAAECLKERGAHTLMTVPGDVPLITTADVKTLMERHRRAPAVTVVPAHDQLGSNAIVCSPPDALIFRFGENSFFPHLARARASGIEPLIVSNPRLALDIDTPDDLAAFATHAQTTQTRRYLESINLAQKLEQLIAD